MFITKSQIKFKTLMFKSSLCDYSDAYILVRGTIEIPITGTAAVPNNRKNMIIKNYAPFTNCISETHNTQIDNVKDIEVDIYNKTLCMLMYNLIEYRDKY